MRQRLVVAVVGAITIAMTGCASEDTTTTTTASPSPASPSPAASPGQKQVGAQPFAKPLVAQKPANVPAVPGLIQLTNADVRAKQVQASINAQRNKDPFATLPLPIQRTTTPQATATSRLPALPNPPKPGGFPNGLTPPNPSSPFPPRSQPNTPAARPVPPPPSTTLADAVEVSGVVYVNGVVQAIVKAPQEGSTRYVRVGQRLSDGQVLVKRIEMNRGSDPVVIFEQNGVEVSKTVGEKAPQASNPTTG